jgi:hypothetical protein
VHTIEGSPPAGKVRHLIRLYRTAVGPRTRRALRLAITAASVVLVWAVLVLPDRLYQLHPADFARIPVEGLALVAVALVLSAWPRRIVAAVAGILFGVLTLFKLLNMAFYLELDRAFNPVIDESNLSPGIGVIRAAIGATRTNIVLAVVWLGIILIIAAITAAAIHVTTVAARHRRASVRALVPLTAVWAVCAGLSLQFVPGAPLASDSTAGLAVAQVRGIHDALADQRQFAQGLNGADPEASVPASDVLTGLRGKDVLIVFVESYGQVAVQGTSFSPGVDAVLRQSTASLANAGWSSQSAWLTSPTFGGISWLAHSTLQSGLWVNTQQRYNELLGSHRFTLSDAFDEAGWHTVADDPSDNRYWAPGAYFYHYDQLFQRHNVGYQGPAFSYASMPDQYTLAAFQRNELTPGHKPVMAEIDLVSSHTPWAPLPAMVPWNQVGNGSIFDPMPAQGPSAITVWRNSSTVRQFYGQSVQYSLQALTSWVTELNDPNLVLIFLGDHQPSETVSGTQPTHNVPIAIVARDPSVFKQIAPWGWQDGLMPGPSAPLEPMDAFRNQFLRTFSKAP